MQWASVNDFLSMGGYGLYVWGSYAVMVAVVLIEILLLKKGRSQTLKLLKRMRNFEDES
jgi:heme exporter protein D